MIKTKKHATTTFFESFYVNIFFRYFFYCCPPVKKISTGRTRHSLSSYWLHLQPPWQPIQAKLYLHSVRKKKRKVAVLASGLGRGRGGVEPFPTKVKSIAFLTCSYSKLSSFLLELIEIYCNSLTLQYRIYSRAVFSCNHYIYKTLAIWYFTLGT